MIERHRFPQDLQTSSKKTTYLREAVMKLAFTSTYSGFWGDRGSVALFFYVDMNCWLFEGDHRRSLKVIGAKNDFPHD